MASARQETRPATLVPVVNEGPTKAGAYDWNARHQAVRDRVRQGKVDLILVGDSITHGWENMPDLWARYFAPRNAVNMGFGWDGTEHVLWRLENGEVDGIRPKVAVVLIGVNNLPRNTVDETAAGVEAVVRTLRRRLPRTKVLLLGVFPWNRDPASPNRQKQVALNAKISALGKLPGVTYRDIGAKFLLPDGTLPADIMPDALHPDRRGYEIWAEAMEPTLARLMGDKRR